MQLNEIEILANELMLRYGLIQKGWKFEFDYAIQRAGCCKHSKNLITLSKYVNVRREYDFVKDTILHEIAHALCPKEHHSKVWKAKAIEIGCNGKRCYTDHSILTESKYIATCPNGHTWYRNRKSKRMQSCGTCDKKFNPKFLLKFKKVVHETSN